MPQGKRNKHNNHRGHKGGGRARGHGPTRGQGQGRGQGRGRGGIPTAVAPSPTPQQRYPHTNAEIDIVVQRWDEPAAATAVVGRANDGRRGGPPKARSGTRTPLRGMDSPRRGDATTSSSSRGGPGRGRGRGRGQTPSAARGRPQLGRGGVRARALGKDAPLSDLLFADRPLLRPITFVRATLTTPVLFLESEEVLKPIDTTATSDVPTAARVAQVFHDNASDSGLESEALPEIDFADLAQVRAEIDAIAQGTQDIDQVDYADLAAYRAQVDAATPRATSRDDIAEEAFTGVYNRIPTSSAADDVPTPPAPGNSLALEPQEQVNITLDAPLDEAIPPTTPETRPVFIEIANKSHHESLPQALDANIVEERAPSSSNTSSDAPLDGAVPFAAPETRPVSIESANESNHEPPPDTITVGEQAPPSSNASLEVPMQALSLSTTPEPHPAFAETSNASYAQTLPQPTNDVPTQVPTAPVDDHGLHAVVPATTPVETTHAHPSGAPRPPSPDPSCFIIDTAPGPPSDVILVDRTGRGDALGDPEDDQIVYIAPHPRGFRPHAGPGPNGREEEKEEEKQDVLALRPALSTSAARRARKKRANVQRARQRRKKRSGFAAMGAMADEARLHEDEDEDTARRQDSDVDWGRDDDDEDDDGDDGQGMDVDPELDLDPHAMQAFVHGMSAEGSQFVTMDEIEDEMRMRVRTGADLGDDPDGRSDAEESAQGDDEADAVFNAQEAVLVGESDDEDALSSGSDDEGYSPRSGFQARLRAVRARSRALHPGVGEDEDSNEAEDAPAMAPGTRADGDEEYLAWIEDMVAQNSQILTAHDPKGKQKQTQTQTQNEFRDDPTFATPVRKQSKRAQFTGEFAAELQAQWDRDRAKKAAYKAERATARLLAALDPLSVSSPGKAQAKAMRAAAPHTLAAHTPDDDALETLVRRFVADGRHSVALPPMDKPARTRLHALAAACGLRSVSKGNGNGRYTTLFRTKGTTVHEGRLRGARARDKKDKKGKGKDSNGVPKHREGDEIGKEAPKIGSSNIGFRMLASMGWAEGDRIGGSASVGIEAPLMAIVKRSKLGLGATRT